MEEVPLAQHAFLTLDNRNALSVQDKKVLLYRFGVVAAIRLARLHDLNVDTRVGPGHTIRFELDERCSSRSADRGRLAEIDHERLIDVATIVIERVQSLGVPEALRSFKTSRVVFNREATLARRATLVAQAASAGAQLVLFPEAVVAGYPQNMTSAPSARASGYLSSDDPRASPRRDSAKSVADGK